MPRFVVIHRIPSPYRLHLFECLNLRLKEIGWDLEVHFMDLCRGDRAHWNEDLDVDFKYRFWRNLKLPGKKGCFNPGLLFYLQKTRPEIVLFGGVWDSVTAMFGIGLLRLPKVIGWYEANDLIPGKMDIFSANLKRFLLSRLDWHALPGQRARNFLSQLFHGEESKFRISYLPNLIDESRFTSRDLNQSKRDAMRERFGLPAGARVIFTPARFIQKKGLIPFLDAFREVQGLNLHYFLVGDGPLKKEILEKICSLGLNQTVTIKSFVAYDEMPDIYAQSDVFCLPSVNDPNPLSVVEALHSGLPVLLSRHLGNFPEAMSMEGHGVSFDPYQKASIVDALKEVAFADDEKLKEMGQKAKAVALEKWGSDLATRRFLEPIL